MDDPADEPPLIAFPERIDRPMRLGPFASSRDALKFVTYAAAGALLVPFASPWVWLPVVAGGFMVSVWHPDGQAVDERAFTFLAWKLRSVGPRGAGAGLTDAPLVRRALLQLPSRRYAAVVRTGGTPIAYLPPDELARRFELYRELLRSMDAGFTWLATTTPIRSQAVRPEMNPVRVEELPAASGYSELVTLLCRRRLLRRIYIVLGTPDASSDAIGRLEGRVANLMERLTALGLRPMRLRDRALAEAARRFGWSMEVRGG